MNAFVDFWLAAAPDETQIRNRGWNAVSRLRDGASLADAQREIAALAVAQAKEDSRLAGLTIQVRPVQDEANRDARSLLLPLFGFVGLLFFVACVNVAGLFVARGLQRDREYAMRAAIGASRVRLFRQVITESAVLALLSAALAAALAAAMVTMFKAIGGQAIPRADMVRASSPSHVQTLKGGRTSAGRAERRLLGGIATVQIVLTVALLSGAALLVRTTSNLARVRPGYDVENILAATVTTVSAPTPAASRAFHSQVLERVNALPGVSRSRVKEIAVRKAVGAQHSEILRSVLGEGGRLILIGVVFGAIVAVLVARGLQSQLYEVGTADPMSLTAAAALFGVVAMTACLFPALRAARTDLASALRQE